MPAVTRDSAGPCQVLWTLADFTRAFDAKRGTKIYDALLKERFPAP